MFGRIMNEISCLLLKTLHRLTDVPYLGFVRNPHYHKMFPSTRVFFSAAFRASSFVANLLGAGSIFLRYNVFPELLERFAAWAFMAELVRLNLLWRLMLPAHDGSDKTMGSSLLFFLALSMRHLSSANMLRMANAFSLPDQTIRSPRSFLTL